MPAINKMREICQQKRLNAKGKMVWAGHWFNRFITRWFSIYFTWLCVRLHISANIVTFLMIVFGLIGVPLLIPHILWLNILGAAALIFAEVLDCVDGEVARWNKKSSLRGVYLDLVSHVLCNSLVSSLCALHLFVLTGENHYLILAFAVYFIAQSRYTLKEEYKIIVSKLSAPDSNTPRASVDLQRRVSKKTLYLIRSFFTYPIDRMSIDHVLVRLLSITAIFLGYAGMLKPMIYLSWWFVIAGIIGIVKEVTVNFFFRIPDVGHQKTFG